jgi:hypothetical protein
MYTTLVENEAYRLIELFGDKAALVAKEKAMTASELPYDETQEWTINFLVLVEVAIKLATEKEKTV